MTKSNTTTNPFGFVAYTAPVKANPYAAVVEAMIAAGEDVAYPLTVPSKDAGKERFKFSNAARDAGKTARLRETTEDAKSGKTTLLFTLSPLRKSGPRAKRTPKA